MAINVAKLLVTIGADTQGLDRGLKESDKQVSSFGKNAGAGLAKVAVAFSAVTLAATGVAAAWNQAMIIGKEGAELEYTATKFDRLSRSINTTADALMTDLYEATRGTMSQAQMMKSAGDLMSLGLAKTHDHVVRLSRVSAGLNMDMNQLVLTLANQTTMRFDQLGVSVDGFQDKVDALKKSGMSASDAFKEAFLQQAEQQLETVGNSADMAAGSFQRFDAAVQDIENSIKLGLMPTLADAAEGMADFLKGESDTSRLVDGLKKQERAVRDTSQSYAEYVETLMVAGEIAGLLDESFRTLYHESMDSGNVDRIRLAYDTLTSQLGLVTEATYNAGKAADASANRFDKMNGAMRAPKMTISLPDADPFEGLVTGAQGAMGELEGLFGRVKSLQGEMEAFIAGLGGQVTQQMGQSMWEGSERFKEGLGVVDDVLGTSYAKEQEQKDSVKALVDQYARSGDLQAFKDGLTAIRDEGLEGMTTELEDATKKAEDLYNKLRNLPAEVRVAIKFDIDDLPPWLENQFGGVRGAGSGDTKERATGGPVWPGQSYLVGERGYEIFQPSSAGRVIPNSEASRGGGSGTLNNYGTIIATQDDPFGARLLEMLV